MDAPSANDDSVTLSVAAVARAARHEVGNLLQKLYAAVAILQARLPAECEIERRTLTELKARAGDCKQWLDAMHDLVFPLVLNEETFDFTALAAERVAAIQVRFSAVRLEVHSAGTAWVRGDRVQLARALDCLLMNMCQCGAGRIITRVVVQLSEQELEWTAADDGPQASAEMASSFFEPFSSCRLGQDELGNALARKLLSYQGGKISAGNTRDGFLVRVLLPLDPSAAGR